VSSPPGSDPVPGSARVSRAGLRVHRKRTLSSVRFVAALELNPFLTISALTERIVENIVVSLTH